MSQANIPNITPMVSISRDDAISLILAFITMDEIGLSYILNAKGEKLQFALGTLPGVTPLVSSISDILNVNQSMQNMLQETDKKEILLSNKLDYALSAQNISGPTGPASDATGATGATGSTDVVSTVTAHNLTTIASTPQTVASGPALVWDTNSVFNGTAITHTVKSPTISLAPNQTYYVSYTADTINNSASNFIGLQLQLNGAAAMGMANFF